MARRNWNRAFPSNRFQSHLADPTRDGTSRTRALRLEFVRKNLTEPHLTEPERSPGIRQDSQSSLFCDP